MGRWPQPYLPEHIKAERSRARYRQWVIANRARANSLVAQWKKRNSEKVNASNRSYAASNRETMRRCKMLAQHKRRESIRASGGNISLGEWSETLEVFNGACAYCLRPASGLDHIDPVSLGGKHEIGNAVPACRRCNSSKGAKPLLQWLISG